MEGHKILLQDLHCALHIKLPIARKKNIHLHTMKQLVRNIVNEKMQKENQTKSTSHNLKILRSVT